MLNQQRLLLLQQLLSVSNNNTTYNPESKEKPPNKHHKPNILHNPPMLERICEIIPHLPPIPGRVKKLRTKQLPTEMREQTKHEGMDLASCCKINKSITQTGKEGISHQIPGSICISYGVGSTVRWLSSKDGWVRSVRFEHGMEGFVEVFTTSKDKNIWLEVPSWNLALLWGSGQSAYWKQ